MKSGRPKRGVIEPLVTLDGTRWIQTDKIPFRDEAGRLTGVIGFAIDITERRRAEESVRALSLVDELTGLFEPPRLLRAGRAAAQDSPRARKAGLFLIFADLDELKRRTTRSAMRPATNCSATRRGRSGRRSATATSSRASAETSSWRW